MSKYIISVGAGINQLPLIETLSNKGYKVIGFDRDKNAPGKEICFLFNSISTWSSKEAIAWLEKMNIHFEAVGCLSCSKAVITYHEIANHFKLPGRMNVSSIKLTQNKREFRKKLISWQLTYVKEFNNVQELTHYLNHLHENKHFVVKPIHGISSFGVKKYNKNDIEQKVRNQEINFNMNLVQEHVNGREFRVIAILQQKTFKYLKLIEKENLEKSFFTARFVPLLEIPLKMMEVIQKLITHLRITDSLLKIDLIYDGKIVEILELDFEIPGDYYETYLSSYFFQQSYLDCYFEFILNKSISNNVQQTKKYLCADYLYNIEKESLNIKYKMVRNALKNVLGDFFLIETKKEGDTAFYPKSNLDNYGLVLHNRKDLSNYEVNKKISNALVNSVCKLC